MVALDEESKIEMMEVIDEESDRLNRFIGGLIELARIEAGAMHLRRMGGTVDEIAFAALQRAEPMTRGHDIEVNIEAELPVVRVDERAVSEVVIHLSTMLRSIRRRVQVFASLHSATTREDRDGGRGSR